MVIDSQVLSGKVLRHIISVKAHSELVQLVQITFNIS